MNLELAMLAASCAFCLVQIVIVSHAASLQRGYRWTASARDGAVAPLTGIAGRLERALRNFLETFPVFVAGVLCFFACVTERRMAEIMRQGQCFREILIQAERPADRTRDLRHFQAVREARAIVIALVVDEHLCLILQPAKGGRMDDPIAIALEHGP